MDAAQLSIGVIGARRVRHGIGPFVAAHLARLGANVKAIAGTSAESVAAAQDDLRRLAGISPRGYADVAEMFNTEDLDAVAICSPDSVHGEQLRLALAAGLHVLCEKPLIFDGRSNPAVTADELAKQFAARGLVLAVNEQWPNTLAGYDELVPSERSSPPEDFRMLLCPGATGLEMIPNSMPHVLSMLFALHGEAAADTATIRDIETCVKYRNEQGEASAAKISFVFVSGGDAERKTNERKTNVVTELQFAASPPRPAAYAIDGRAVNRVIRQPGYRMFLERLELGKGESLLDAAMAMPEDNARVSIPLVDPLPLLLRDFLDRCQQPHPAENKTAVRSLDALWQICEAARANADFAPQVIL